MNGWRHFIYLVASAPGYSALDVQVPAWAMPRIVIVTQSLWIEIGAADAILLRMAVSGFGVDEGDGTFGFEVSSMFRLDVLRGDQDENSATIRMRMDRVAVT